MRSSYITRSILVIGIAATSIFLYNAVRIYQYSHEYYEDQAHVAIVLGAGAGGNSVSPVFRERINHAIYLYNKQLVEKVILTGGYGEGQTRSDSQIAKDYALSAGLPAEAILIEETSRYTIENLKEAKALMDSLGYETALLVSDPLHMKRSVEMARKMNIDCKPSPTKTSMYRSALPKLNSLIYEAFYYTAGKLAGKV